MLPKVGKSALVVDDSEFARLDVLCALPPKYSVVDVASDGTEAIQKIKGFTYDLVLLDLQMPGVNGFEVLEEVLKLPKAHRPYIAIVSSSEATEDVRRSIALGANLYLCKPLIDDSSEPCLLKCLVIPPRGAIEDVRD